MAKQHGIIIWEKSIYCEVPGKGWTRQALPRLEDAVTVIQEHCEKNASLTFLYDPDTLHTEFTECPLGGRAVLREALASAHDSIANPHTAWGFQTPWPLSATSGGNQGTFCSYETAPSLYLLNQTLGDLGYTMARAFPMASLTAQGGITPGRTGILLVIDQPQGQTFIYIYTSTGIRTCRKLYGAGRADYDIWSEISMVLGEYGVTFDDGGQRPQVRIYQAPGNDCKTQCPYWDILSRQAQVELFDFGSLIMLTRAVPAGHSSSLLSDLPRSLRVDFGFQVTAAIFGFILVGFGIYAWLDLRKEHKEITARRRTERSYTDQKYRLEQNRREIENLRTLYSQEIFELSRGRLGLVESLATAIPRDATLLSVSAGGEEDARFHIRGVFWNRQPAASSAANAGLSHSSTPLSAIKSELERTVGGLLVDETKTNMTPDSGEFAMEGTTPLPEHAATVPGWKPSTSLPAVSPTGGIPRPAPVQ
ncbi:hypothetical protein OpiT1DRAFT_04472 [Opitutaceae bacterium TAV1]|nr:hypothetical protein OpiT1DRAFT_04472 [Opitutaceae bacterium TAV1]